MSTPRADDLFSDAKDPVDVVNRWENYKASLTKALARPVPAPHSTGSTSALGQLHKAVADAELSKSLDPKTVTSVRNALAGIDLGKDLTVAGPGSTGGLVAYDLQAPALQLAPKMTPLRNRMPRRRGIGTSHRFKRITGWSNSSTGGVADLWAGIGETDTNSVAGQSWRRGPVIQYAGDQFSIPYMTFSLSNSVSWESEYAGAGFQDIRSFATSSLLYSSMVFEEKCLIEGRGTASPFGGGLGAPTGVTVTCGAPGTGQTATTGVTSKVWAVVTAITRFGETPISASGNGAWTSGQLATVSWTPVTGAYQYRVFVGTGSSDPTSAAEWLLTTTSATTVAVQGALPTSGTAASTVNGSDSTAKASGYDGILANVLGPHSGYVNRVNGPLSDNAGDEIQQVCIKLQDAVKGDPDEVICSGYDRKILSDKLKAANSSNYRLQLTQSEAHGATIGSLVTAIQNQTTGKMLDVTMNPWWPQGTMAVMSWSLPIPDSQVGEVWALYGPQDFMSVEWPAQQFSYDSSTFWMNSLVCFAPEWNGAVTGITV